MRLSSLLTATLLLTPLAAQHGFTPEQRAELRAIIRSEIQAAMHQAHAVHAEAIEFKPGKQVEHEAKIDRVGAAPKWHAMETDKGGRFKANTTTLFGHYDTEGKSITFQPEIVKGKDGTLTVMLKGLEGKGLPAECEVECEVHVVDPHGKVTKSGSIERASVATLTKHIEMSLKHLGTEKGEGISFDHSKLKKAGAHGEEIWSYHSSKATGHAHGQQHHSEGAKKCCGECKEEAGRASGHGEGGTCTDCHATAKKATQAKQIVKAHQGAIMVLQGSGHGEPTVTYHPTIEKGQLQELLKAHGKNPKVRQLIASCTPTTTTLGCKETEKAGSECCGECEEEKECSGSCGEGGKCCQEKAEKSSKSKTFTFVINGEGQTGTMTLVPRKSKASGCSGECSEKKECGSECEEEEECSGSCGEGGECCQEKAEKAAGCGSACGSSEKKAGCGECEEEEEECSGSCGEGGKGCHEKAEKASGCGSACGSSEKKEGCGECEEEKECSGSCGEGSQGCHEKAEKASGCGSACGSSEKKEGCGECEEEKECSGSCGSKAEKKTEKKVNKKVETKVIRLRRIRA